MVITKLDLNKDIGGEGSGLERDFHGTASWRKVRLRSVLTQPATYGVVKAGKFQISGIPMVRGGDIKQGRISRNLPHITGEKDTEYSRTRLKSDDVVIALVGYPGEAAVVPERLKGANISRAVGLLRPSPDIDPEYLASYLNSPIGRAEFLKPGAGSAQLVVNLRDLNRLAVPLPSLTEQKAIAHAVTNAERCISSIEELIAKKTRIKKGAMQELLSGRRRLPGFAEDWEAKSFDRIFYRVNSKEHQIQTTDYKNVGPYQIVDQGQKPVVAYSDREDRLFKCPEGGVIVFGDHTCIVKFVNHDFVVGADGTQVIVAKSGYSTRFFAYQLKWKGVEPTGYNRHFKDLRQKILLIPPVAEQQAIARVLADLDYEIEVLEARLEKARQIKQGMMQELLTGRVRLV